MNLHVFAGVLAVMAYLAVCVVLFCYAVGSFAPDYKRPKRPLRGWLCASALVLIIATTIAFVWDSDGGPDPYANRLCLHGHQEWTRVYSGRTSHLEKVWACEVWEVR